MEGIAIIAFNFVGCCFSLFPSEIFSSQNDSQISLKHKRHTSTSCKTLREQKSYILYFTAIEDHTHEQILIHTTHLTLNSS